MIIIGFNITSIIEIEFDISLVIELGLILLSLDIALYLDKV